MLLQVVQVHEVKQQQEAGQAGRQGQAGHQDFLTTLTLRLTMTSSGGRDVDHQGGDGGGQREVLVHGEQQRRWREC